MRKVTPTDGPPEPSVHEEKLFLPEAVQTNPDSGRISVSAFFVLLGSSPKKSNNVKT